MYNYLEDVLEQLIDNAVDIKKNATTELDKGKLLGYYEAISIILNKAEAFGISDKIRPYFRDYNPDKLI